MENITKAIWNFIQPMFPFLFRDSVIFLIALAIVYTIGRMLEIAKTSKSRNLIAFLVIIASQAFCVYFLDKKIDVVNFVVYFMPNFSISTILYVVLGFNFFDRCDDFLDKRFGKDKRKK